MAEHRQSISVILCAYTLDRWDDISEAIASLQRQTRPPDEILLVVDHNPELLARAAEGFPGVKVAANRQARGLSGGRNTGLELARGDLIVFFDDDAVAREDWIERLQRRCGGEDVLGVTNPVHPIWVGTRPGWFPDEFLWVVGCTFPGAEVLAGGEVRNLLGGSMMLRRDVFDAVGGFNAGLGRKEANANLLSCEETELCIRAKAAFPEGRFLSDASAVIWHKVGASRLTVRYFCRRTYAEGLSKARVAALATRPGPLGTERGYVFRVLGRSVLRNLGAGLVGLDRHALARAGVTVLGLACASLGFVRGQRMWAAAGHREDGGRAGAPRSQPGASARAADAVAEG